MADGWFIQRDGQKLGPYSSAQLKQMTTTGQLLPVDLVSKGEAGCWVPSSQIKGLFAAPVKQPPPLNAPPPLVTGALPPPLPDSPFEFGSGPPPVPEATPNSGATIEIVDRNAVVMGADAYLLALKRSAGEPVGPWDMPVVGRLLGAKGLLPARIALPVLGMLAVLGSTLILSLFGVKEAVTDTHDLRFQLLIAFALLHSVLGIIANVMTARLQHTPAATVAAVLTMTVYGWYVFALGWPIVWILGLMAGVSVGGWALFTFRSPNVRAMFADAGKPGPLDRFGTPVLAGAAGGLLAVILGVGGVLYMVARDKTNNPASGNSDPSGGNRQMKSRQMPEPRQMKSRTGGTEDEDDIGSEVVGKQVTANDLNSRNFAQIERLLGQPTEVYRSKKKQNLGLAIWATGDDKYAVVSFAESIDGSSPTLVLTREVNRTRSIVDNMKRAIDK